MIRCIRIWTTDAGQSAFEEGHIALGGDKPGDAIGDAFDAASVSFRETVPSSALEWHDAPTRQLVLTLGGTLEFETRDGDTFIVRPGDVLLAEDTTGGGHRWRLIGEEPWRRAYVILPTGTDAVFQAA